MVFGDGTLGGNQVMRVEPPHHLSCQDPERRQKSVNQEDISPQTPNLILEFPGSRTMSSGLLLFLNHPVLLLKEPEQTKEEGLSGSCQLRLESVSRVSKPSPKCVQWYSMPPPPWTMGASVWPSSLSGIIGPQAFSESLLTNMDWCHRQCHHPQWRLSVENTHLCSCFSNHHLWIPSASIVFTEWIRLQMETVCTDTIWPPGQPPIWQRDPWLGWFWLKLSPVGECQWPPPPKYQLTHKSH